jgi:SAM-dependent methyltransferase
MTPAAVQFNAPSRTYIRVPDRRALNPVTRIGRGMMGAILAPAYWALAYRYGVPGLAFRKNCVRLGFRLLSHEVSKRSLAEICRLWFWPMDSVRYFEFDFAWQALSGSSVIRYLDVSSPRLFPIVLLDQQTKVQAELLNPDAKDLNQTTKMIGALGLESHCNFHACLIADLPFSSAMFDLITSISVVEHIPNDKMAIQKMWQLLKPGGRLVLTVPCASETREEFIDRNEYGLLEPCEDHFYFYQRYYDQKLLEENIFSVTGAPRRFAVYGEKVSGTYRKNEEAKRADPFYPIWREPYAMGQVYQYFRSIDDLPGVGVIGMEFKKN